MAIAPIFSARKCFFETYRFSEDLDFTLTDESHIDVGFLKNTLAQIADRIYETTGIELPPDSHRFEIYTNPQGNEATIDSSQFGEVVPL